MFNDLLVAVLEATFWCFLILTVLSIKPADARYINWLKRFNNRRIFQTNEMGSENGILRRIPISRQQVVDDGAFISSQNSSNITSGQSTAINSTHGKRFILYNELAKLKYSNDLRKICHYNRINKMFNETLIQTKRNKVVTVHSVTN